MLKILEGKSVLCSFGIHKWSNIKMHMIESSNVWDKEKYCLKCGKYKRWSVLR